MVELTDLLRSATNFPNVITSSLMNFAENYKTDETANPTSQSNSLRWRKNVFYASATFYCESSPHFLSKSLGWTLLNLNNWSKLLQWCLFHISTLNFAVNVNSGYPVWCSFKLKHCKVTMILKNFYIMLVFNYISYN